MSLETKRRHDEGGTPPPSRPKHHVIDAKCSLKDDDEDVIDDNDDVNPRRHDPAATTRPQTGSIDPPASATPWFYHMAYKRYWEHWRQVQLWLKAVESARKKAEKDKNKVLKGSQNFGGGYVGETPSAAFGASTTPFMPYFYDADGE